MAIDDRTGPVGSADAAAGLRRLEGYLYWQAETDRAHEDAEAFADRLPWLTTAQREDLVRLYRRERLQTSRAFIERVSDRAEQLQREYSARYEHLRICAIGTTLALAAAFCVAERLF